MLRGCRIAKPKLNVSVQVRKQQGFNPKDKRLVLTSDDVSEALAEVG